MARQNGVIDKNSIIKKVEELCSKLVQNYENWDKEAEEWKSKVEKEGGFTPEKESKHRFESKKMEEKFLGIRNKIYKEIKDQILKDLTLWVSDWEGNIQPIPGISVNTDGAGGGFRLLSYKPGQSYINFPYEEYKEITRAFVEEIKQNPQDWKIEIEEEDSDYQIVKHKSGRKHYRGYQAYSWRPGFSDEEWAEIEALVSKSPISNKNNDNGIELIKKIFQAHHISEITFENGQLSIEYDNKVNSVEKPVNNSEKQTLEKYCQEHKKRRLTAQRLGISSDSTSPSLNNPKPNNHHLAIFLFGGTLLVAVLVTIGLVVKKRKAK